MADSYTVCINKIDQFLKENDERDWKGTDPLWFKLFIDAYLKLLKSFVCYTGNWSDEDKTKHLEPLSSTPEAQLENFPDYVSSVICTQPNAYAQYCIYFRGSWIPLNLQLEMASAYEYLLGVSHPPIGNHHFFSQFAASVQEYVVSFSLELQRYIQCCGGDESYEWLPSYSSVVESHYTATAQKLGGLRCFICDFVKWCIDQQKLQNYLARASALVLNVAHLACENQTDRQYSSTSPLEMVFRSSYLSRKLSSLNPKVMEIYREVLGEYAEIINAAKPSSGPVISMAFEDMVGSYVSLLHFTENQVDILVCILDNLSLNPVVKLDDLNEQVEMLLRLGVSAVAREAGSLSSLIPNILFSKLWHKLNLIKAEIFVLELDNQKPNLMVSAHNPVAIFSEAFRFLSKFFKTPEVYMEVRGKLILALIEDLLREAGSSCDSHQAQKFTEDMILKSSLAILKLFKAEAMLMVLIDNSTSLKFLARYRIETLQKALIFLRALFSDPPNDDIKDGNFSTIIEALAREATTLVCSFGGNKLERISPGS